MSIQAVFIHNGADTLASLAAIVAGLLVNVVEAAFLLINSPNMFHPRHLLQQLGNKPYWIGRFLRL